MDDHDDELLDAVRELTRTIDDLREELDGPHSRRRPPLRPPTPRELLRFTDEIALPAVLTALETSVRALEAFQRSLRVVRTEREARERTGEAVEATSERASELRRTTLSQLDTVLAELQRAASDGGLPADETARDLLKEARDLRDDVDGRLRDAADRESQPGDAGPDRPDPEGGVTIDIDDGPLTDDRSETDDADDGRDSAVDVDAELETLRDQYADEGDSDSSETEIDDAGSDDDGDGTAADDTDAGAPGSDAGDDEN
ncbi:DUF7547 family protein [Natrinema versiforme]|uniref:Uncharacterized protein n=1 Tax=Natrinema versiforme JCM 10478 TaxID=1227496 RepID=L9Y7M4_9EURY|nr:hypothetical protein [Natrinema versiforme]ELY69717.1 hypothetical protein C489_04062 [Natrinema versiforme JCM 10478]